MNPNDAYPGYDSTYFDRIMRAAKSYHTSVDFTTDQETMDVLLGKANASIDTKSEPEQEQDSEPYDNAQIIREIDYSNFTEEELNQAIDHLHEVLLHKRGESLLDLEPGLE